MTRIGFLVVISTVLLLLTPARASAGCTQADLTGTWQVYVSSAYESGYWTRFSIKINARGKVTVKSMIDSYGRRSSASGTIGGQLNVSSACNVTGSIGQSSDTYSISIRIDQGTLNRSKDTMGAVGIDTESAYACTISAFKR